MAWRESRRTVSSSFSVGDDRISMLDLDYLPDRGEIAYWLPR